MYSLFFKRLLDLIVSIIGLLLLIPLLIIIWILLTFQNKGNSAIFRQDRTGKNEKTFKIFKFKTMNDTRDINGNLLADKHRITRIGKVIRISSLDEIPQLINVLKGDMSIVGPRPLRTYYVPLYNEIQRKRHLVKPGITGWAQVNGRNSLSWKEKFELDVYYVDKFNLLFDLKIIMLTLLKVIKCEGIYSSTNAQIEPFNGNN